MSLLRYVVILEIAFAAASFAQSPVSFLEGRGFGKHGGDAIAIADFNHDGKLDVAATDATGLTIFLGTGDGSFRELQPTAAAGASIFSADFNRDGNADLLISGADYDGGVVLLMGKGDGTFQNSIPLPIKAYLAAVGDFNGDGNPDVAVVTSPGLQVLFGDGKGGFSAGPLTSLPTPNVQAIIAGDFNNDGRYDLAMTALGYPTPNGYVEVLFGKGDGTFSIQQIPISPASDALPIALTSADFNQDGFPDLAVADFNYSTLSILYGSSSGTFATPVMVANLERPVSVAAIDLDGDGVPDLVAASGLAHAAVFHNAGDGNFHLEQDLVTMWTNYITPAQNQIVAADLTASGGLDLIVTCSSNVELAEPAFLVLDASGSGRFRDSEAYQVGYHPESFATADFNGDGHLDAAVSVHKQGILVFSGDGQGRLEHPRKIDMPKARRVAAGDANGDGYADLVVASAGRLQTLPGLGNGKFGKPISSPCKGCGGVLVLADVNHDGRLDAITTSGRELAVLLGNGNGTFAAATKIPLSAATVAVADINGDGNPDLVVTSRLVVYIVYGNGDGTFAAPFPLDGEGSDSVVADFNGDGIPDIAAIQNGSVAIYLGKGNGVFSPPLQVRGPQVTGPLVAADFNGDGRVDLVANIAVQSAYSLFTNGVFMLGKGDGTFATQRRQFGLSDGAIPLRHGFTHPIFEAGDFNGNGKSDLLTAVPYGESIWLLVNDSR